MWPGLVGKGDGAEPPIMLERMLDLTAQASADGAKFDGVDIFLAEPHTPIDADDDGLKALADAVGGRGLVIGSCVAPVWPPAGGGSAMGDQDERKKFLEAVRKACGIGRRLREMGVRPYGVIRIDSATGTEAWAADPVENSKKIVATFKEAATIAEGEGERLAAEGEICWGAMHSWRAMVDTLEAVDRPDVLGFQADMAHTLLYTMGTNAPEARILPEGYDWADGPTLDAALKLLTGVLRPWTIDFHVAQSDGSVFGSGSHDKTGKHATVDDPGGKLDPVKHAGYWMRDSFGQPTKAFKHICWDGCMFPNATLERQDTWNDILGVMVKVRETHGWNDHG
ncbi:MAG: TIM barrel protein [Pseudomonadota bacterium]